MTWPGMGETVEQPLFEGAVELQSATRSAQLPSSVADDWLCAGCLHRVVTEKDRFNFDGRGEFTFRNPDGIQFEIILFSQTQGCVETGPATLQHTWFAAHAWSFCHCAGCGQHLGWYYSGPSQFAGLIRVRIVRASTIYN